MAMHQKKRSLYTIIPLLCLTFAAVIWKGMNDRFPYSGEWGDAKFAVQFDESGHCNMLTANLDGKSVVMPATYHMQGDAAVVTYSFTISRESRKDLHITHKQRFTPVKGGKMLRFEFIESHVNGKPKPIQEDGTTPYLNKRVD